MIYDGGIMAPFGNWFALQYLYEYLYAKLLVFNISTGVILSWDVYSPGNSFTGYVAVSNDEGIYVPYSSVAIDYCTGVIGATLAASAVNKVNSQLSGGSVMTNTFNHVLYNYSNNWYKSTNRLASSSVIAALAGKTVQAILRDDTYQVYNAGNIDIYTNAFVKTLTNPDAENYTFRGYDSNNYCWRSASGVVVYESNVLTANYSFTETVNAVLYESSTSILALCTTGTEVVIYRLVGGNKTEIKRITGVSINQMKLIENQLLMCIDRNIVVYDLAEGTTLTIATQSFFDSSSPNRQIRQFFKIF